MRCRIVLTWNRRDEVVERVTPLEAAKMFCHVTSAMVS